VLALVLGMAQPLVRSGWLGGGGARDVIVLLDTSMSTAQHAGDGSLFDRLLERADQLVAGLNEQDTVRVMLASQTPQWLVPAAVSMNGEAANQLRARMREVKPTLAAGDMPRCVEEAIAAEGRDQAQRIVTVLTDGQAYGWRPAAGSTWRSLHEQASKRGKEAIINVVNVGDAPNARNNLSLEAVSLSRLLAGRGEPLILTASVINRGNVASDSATLAWSQAGQALGVTSLKPLAAGESTAVDFEHIFESPGVYELGCTIDRSDDLVLDNRGHVVVEVVESLPILVVDGSPRADPLETQTGYLLAALGQTSDKRDKPWKSVFNADLIEPSELSSKDLSQYRCVVLADALAVPDAQITRLKAFVRSGGGLWIALGGSADPGRFNAAFFDAGQSLSPLALDTSVGDADDREHFEPLKLPMDNHPATRLLADTQRLDIDHVKLYRRHRFAPPGAGQKPSVLLSTRDGSPVAVEKLYGRGRVIVQAVPLGVRWSNLPSCQAFVVLVNEWLAYLTEPTMTRWNLNVGEPLNVSLPADHFGQVADLITPAGDTLHVRAEVRDHQHVFHDARTLWPGLYALSVEDRQGERRRFPLQVQRDAEESDLTPLSEADTQTLASAGGLHFVSDPLAGSNVGRRFVHREPVWTWVLAGLLALLLIESLLAGRLTRRRNLQASIPVPELFSPGVQAR